MPKQVIKKKFLQVGLRKNFHIPGYIYIYISLLHVKLAIKVFNFKVILYIGRAEHLVGSV